MIFYTTPKGEKDNGIQDNTILEVLGDSYKFLEHTTELYKVEVSCIATNEDETKAKLEATEGVTIITEEQYNS